MKECGKRSHIAVACAFGLLFAMAAAWAPAAHAAPPVEAHVILKVEGMTCPSCAAAVHLALGRLDGVREAKVSFEGKQARVIYDPAKVTPEQMVRAVDELGYRATVQGESHILHLPEGGGQRDE